jgi:hypothetical protein
MKIVLYGEDGKTEHGSGIVDDKFAKHKLVERNGHIYAYDTFTFEDKQIIAYYHEVHRPVVITEF